MKHTVKRYYKSEEELLSFLGNVKQMVCPHCGLIGALILHGFLYGYEECSANIQIIRGRRIFCNNRKSRNKGCGRTFSILAATMLENFSISASSLWSFLKGIITLPDRLPCFRRLKITLDESAAYRLWKRFVHALPKIRSVLSRYSPQPQLPAAACAATQTIAHLQTIFKKASCPIAAFQHRFGVSFL